MSDSVFELFNIGIGPSSSHTVGPMRAALRFVHGLEERGLIDDAAILRVDLYGSLGATGKGHGADKAIILGLEGETPDAVDIDAISGRLKCIRKDKKLSLLGRKEIAFVEKKHLVMHKRKRLPYHPNGMSFQACDDRGKELQRKIYYSIGGGTIVDKAIAKANRLDMERGRLSYPFATAADLLSQCQQHGMPISEVILENEKTWRSEEEVRNRLLEIWHVMQACVKRGCSNEGVMPGGLKVKRRAKALKKILKSQPEAALCDPLTIMDWVNLYALAVNEENASGGRVVTAPTNGAAGVIPAVLHYYTRFCSSANDAGVIRFLLTAGGIGILYTKNASISGAEVGCQGEVGAACSMAAGALTEVLGGTPSQVENAAEIGMEHNLGLTCDPVGGLVQIPCIERNAMAAVKAINAARIALRGDGAHFVSLDKVIKTMRDTGADMRSKYKETARGGLAVNVVEC
ncbi:MAG: L-serine ammonia-lyase [Sedimenticola sp.]